MTAHPQAEPIASTTSGTFTMYTTPWCGYCHRLQGQLDREGITYDVVDIERDPSAAEVVMAANNGNQTVPTLVYSRRHRAHEPLRRPGQGKAGGDRLTEQA